MIEYEIKFFYEKYFQVNFYSRFIFLSSSILKTARKTTKSFSKIFLCEFCYDFRLENNRDEFGVKQCVSQNDKSRRFS